MQKISEQTGIPIGKIYNWWKLSQVPSYDVGRLRTLERSIIPQQIIDGLKAQRHQMNQKFDDMTIGQVLVWKAEGVTTTAICKQEGLLNSFTIDNWWRLYKHHIYDGPEPDAQGTKE